MKVPKRFDAASLTDWSADHPIRQTGVTFLKDLDTFIAHGIAPVFAGQTGKGKSHGAAALLNDIQRHSNTDITVEWFSAADVFNQLADLKDARISTAYFEILSQLQETPLIVIDDMTALRETPRLREYLWMVLNHRYEEFLPTIITVNSNERSVNDILRELSIWSSQSIARRIRDCSRELFTIV